jgi:S-ribosylhomocysteine lyase
MKKIASFTVNHLNLLTGVYVSRKDYLQSDVLTTFDLRFTKPNDEPVMDTDAIHAIEHLGATFLRNDEEWASKVIYFGPMGCRTGFYLILAGDLESKQIIDLLNRMLVFIIGYEGEIPGASARDCGNYIDLNLPMAKFYAKKYLNEVIKNISEERMTYPND